jgi:acyl-CoA thioesterase FadM
MNLLLRLLLVVLRALAGRRLALLADTSVLHLRVWPTDLDLNLHMTNSRYLSVMDLGRFDLLIRAGLARPVLANRLQPVVGGIRIAFRRPLAPLQCYRMETRLLGWTEHVMVVRHRLLIGPPAAEDLAAEADVRFLLLRRGQKVPSRELLATIGIRTASPPLGDDIAAWAERPGAAPGLAEAAAGR